MAKSIIFQGVTEDSHLPAVSAILGIPDPERIILSVAFMNQRGLSALSDALSPVAEDTTIIAGIRNGITSAQGLIKSLELGCTTYVVDTGTRAIIFHPKIYYSRNATEARLIVGSANLTLGGLNSNIEASLLMTLDLSDQSNKDFCDSLEEKIDGMIDEYDENVLEVPDTEFVQQLLVSGRVIDEQVSQAPRPMTSSHNRELDTVTKMALKSERIIHTPVDPIVIAPLPEEHEEADAPAPTPSHLSQVWISRPLTRRDLSIPQNPNTHLTGSMLLKRGIMEGIDHRHYFRDSVFDQAAWTQDPAPNEYKERAVVNVQIIIRDVNYGVYNLQISHDTRTDTRSYRQSNGMTHLHWGEARPLVSKEDLLERTLTLYRDEANPDAFVLEID